MKRIIQTVICWDDLELAEGREVTATTTVRLAYHSGRTGPPAQVELDLSTFNRDVLEKVLAPWLKVGHRPAEPMPAAGRARKGTGTTHRAGIRAYNREMRAFADAHGGPGDAGHLYHYHVATYGPDGKPRGKYYYSLSLRGKYAAHLEQEGKD